MEENISPSASTNINRRTALKLGLGTASTVGLSGCISTFRSGQGGEYPSSDIRILTQASGSLFDLWARAFAEFAPDHLDSDIDVIVENISGSREATNRAYSAESDGYNVGYYNIPGNLNLQLNFDVNYDVTEVNWLGRAANYEYVLFVNPDLGFESLDDLREADDLTFAPSAPEATDAFLTILANDRLGIEASSYVSGFDSGLDALTAVERGDADARYQVGPMVTDRIEAGDIQPLLVINDEPVDYAPDVPTIVDEGHEDLADVGLQAFVGAPPNVEEDRLSVLRDLFMNVHTSSEMEEWAADNEPPGLGLDPVDHEECANILSNLESLISNNAQLIEEELSKL